MRGASLLLRAVHNRDGFTIRCMLIVLAVFLFAGCLVSATRLGMTENVHLRYTAHAFPSVLSHLNYGLPWDYTAYEGVTAFLVNNRENSNALEDATKLVDYNRELRFFPFDDKGYADLALLGFKIFGTKVSSVFWAYVLLLGISLAAFILAYRKDIVGLILMNVVLSGIYVSIPAFPVSAELGSITNPRAIGMLSFLALAHVIYLSFTVRKVTVVDILTALPQCMLVSFVIFVRSPEIWQAGIISATCVCALVVRRRLHHPTIGPLIGLVAIIVCITGLGLYQRTFFHPSYFDKYGQTRLMWHNVGIAFALNPTLAKTYNFRVSDGAMFNLVAERARTAGIYDDVFTDQDKVLFNPIKDFVKYDNLARDAVLDIASKHPWQVLNTFILYKPYYIVKTFMSAIGYEDDKRPDFEVSYLTHQQRLDKDAFLSYTRLLPLLTMLLSSLALFRFGLHGWISIVSVIGLIWIGSMIPSFASYPLYHIVGFLFASTSALAYVLFLGLLLISIRMIIGLRPLPYWKVSDPK